MTKLETAYIYERAIDHDRYDRHHTGLEQQLTAGRVAMDDARTDDLDIEGALRVASRMLTSAATVYATMAPVTRRKFLGGSKSDRMGSGTLWSNQNPNQGLCLSVFQCQKHGVTWQVVRPEGFEPPTLGSEDRCSIQLSYGRTGTYEDFACFGWHWLA